MKLSGPYSFIHMESRSRLFHSPFRVQSIGYIHQKKDHMAREFRTLNFSLILSGKGYVMVEGKRIALEAPLVLTQLPGAMARYGPEPTWEELFFIYPPEAFPAFRTRGFLEKPFWKITHPGHIKRLVQELDALLEAERDPSMPDRCDLLIERIILESLREKQGQGDTPLQELLYRLHDRMNDDCREPRDFHHIARKAGFSPSTFRRAWQKEYGLPPAQVLQEIRMHNAARLLAETTIPVKQVAMETGYADPLYFSKVFRKKYAESPLEYRTRTQNPCTE